MREKGIDEEETERRFSRGERIGADPLAPRGRPPLEHTAGDGQRLRRARPPRPMPCNLYRRHCLTAPSRRRATASTHHHPRVMRREPFFFRRSDFRSLFLVRATRRRDFGLFLQTGWLCVGCAGMPTDTPKTHADTAVASCPPLSLFPPGSRSDGSDVTARDERRRERTTDPISNHRIRVQTHSPTPIRRYSRARASSQPRAFVRREESRSSEARGDGCLRARRPTGSPTTAVIRGRIGAQNQATQRQMPRGS